MLHTPVTTSLGALVSLFASVAMLGILIGLAIGAREIRRERCERERLRRADLAELHRRMGIEP